jgi:hypothetical protein
VHPQPPSYLLAAALFHAPSLHSCIIFPPSSSHHCVLPCSQKVQRDKLLRGLRRPEPAEPKAKSTPKRGLVAGAVMHGTHTTTFNAILRKGTVGGFSKCGGVNLGCRTLLRCVHLEPKLRTSHERGRARVLGQPSNPPTTGGDTRHPAPPHEHIPASVIPGRPHQCPCYKMCSGGGREHGRPRGEGTPPRPPPGRSSPHQSKRLHPVSC